MLLSYETSSLSYDDIDLIHGKFIPAQSRNFYSDCSNKDCLTYIPSYAPVRIFVNIYGVFANLSGRFAEKYDNLELPDRVEGIVDPDFIRLNIPKSGVEAIMEEDMFWKDMLPYPWYILLTQEMYNICGGELYMLLPMYDSLQLEDRLIWVWRHFGNQARSRTALASYEMACMLIKSRNDILISSDLRNCELWTQRGGSAFWWSEINSNCKEPAVILRKRIKILSNAIYDLKHLSPDGDGNNSP